MEVAGFVGILIIVGIAVVAVIIVGLILLLFARSWIKVARADEALVISGRKQKVQSTVLDADGSSRSELSESPVTVIVNGKSLVNPITQRHEIISLRSRQVMLNAEAQSLDNVTLNVDGVAIVKIGSDPLFVRRAAERFASQDAAIEQFTTEQLEGALRGIVATLSVVELMRERKKFSDQIAADVSHELAEQGLILDSFQIKGITDSVGYIQSLGSPEIQAKRQAAEIAQTNADRAINQKNIANDEANLIEQTALDTNTANAAAGVGRARAEAEQAEQLARAKAEQAVLQQQAENKQAQLDADVKRVADAQRALCVRVERLEGLVVVLDLCLDKGHFGGEARCGASAVHLSNTARHCGERLKRLHLGVGYALHVLHCDVVHVLEPLLELRRGELGFGYYRVKAFVANGGGGVGGGSTAATSARDSANISHARGMARGA